MFNTIEEKVNINYGNFKYCFNSSTLRGFEKNSNHLKLIFDLNFVIHFILNQNVTLHLDNYIDIFSLRGAK